MTAEGTAVFGEAVAMAVDRMKNTKGKGSKVIILLTDGDDNMSKAILPVPAAELAAALGAWQRAGFDADVAFNVAAGLPGGRREIALFHYAIDGLLLDRLTTPIDPETSTDDVIDDLVAGLLP